jgi:hypothetical protein
MECGLPKDLDLFFLRISGGKNKIDIHEMQAFSKINVGT